MSFNELQRVSMSCNVNTSTQRIRRDISYQDISGHRLQRLVLLMQSASDLCQLHLCLIVLKPRRSRWVALGFALKCSRFAILMYKCIIAHTVTYHRLHCVLHVTNVTIVCTVCTCIISFAIVVQTELQTNVFLLHPGAIVSLALRQLLAEGEPPAHWHWYPTRHNKVVKA